jgi:hypothetical protein
MYASVTTRKTIASNWIRNDSTIHGFNIAISFRYGYEGGEESSGINDVHWMNGKRRVSLQIVFMCARVVASAVQPAAAVFNKNDAHGIRRRRQENRTSTAVVLGSEPQEGPRTISSVFFFLLFLFGRCRRKHPPIGFFHTVSTPIYIPLYCAYFSLSFYINVKLKGGMFAGMFCRGRLNSQNEQ